MSVDVAVIGAGNIGSKHLGRLGENDRANVAAVCDVDEAAADQWAADLDAAAVSDWERLFDEAAFEAVFLCVPPFAHEGQELRAIEAGVDLFVEKPLGLDPAYVREVRAAVAEADVLTQVGHHMRYADPVVRARELVGDRTLAAIYGRWIGGVPGGADHWWRHREQSGGQVIEQSTHTFDLVRYFGGPVDSVTATGDLRVREDLLDFPDAVAATLRHEDGLPSQVVSSAASPSWDHGLTIVGEDLHLEIQDGVCEGVVDGDEVGVESESDGHHVEVDAFVDAVADRDPTRCRSPYADAAETFALTKAVTDAVEAGGPVEVAL